MVMGMTTVNAAEIPTESLPLYVNDESVIIAESYIADILGEVKNGLGYADAVNKASSDTDNRKRPALQGRTLSVTEWFATIFTPGIRNDPCKNHSFQIRAEAPRIAAF